MTNADYGIFVGIALGFSLIAMIAGLLAALWAGDAVTTVKAMKESTHRIEYMPLDVNNLGKSEDLGYPSPEDNEVEEESSSDTYQKYLDRIQKAQQSKEKELHKASGAQEEDWDSLID